MNFPSKKLPRTPMISILLGCALGVCALAQDQKSIISLDPPEGRHVQAMALNGRPLPPGPSHFRHFPDAAVGDLADAQRLTLRFAEATKLTGITSTKDFKIEQGSSCVEGNLYQANQTCMLLVRFTPQGPGHRLGKIIVSHSASPTPYYVGLGGNSYAPVLSFTPAVISTVAASYPAGKGLLTNASNLSVDGGDTLYIADTGNNLIRAMDSSGVIKTVSSGTLSSPWGVVADNFGEVFFDEPAQNTVFEIFDYGSQFQLGGAGSDNCTATATCSINSEKIYLPGQMSIDPNNDIVLVEQLRGAMEMIAQPYPAQIARLYDPFTFQNVNQGVIAVDAYDNIYSLWSITNVCQILSEYFSDAANSHQVYKKVAGGKTCGFSGDGGEARNAEISATVNQMAFDVAGNLYFTDGGNQRVRRIDYSTGIITTIAGTGTAGYNGDGGAATLSALSTPTGIAVDSQGQVYIISGTAATGSAQVIRKLGVTGALPFGNQVKGTVSAAKTITLSNTGNSTLTFTGAFFTGTNPTEFAIDPVTTSCNLVAGGTLANGQSCKVGVIFKPAANGTRTANLVFNDNTVTNSNSVSLYGPAVLPSPTFAITAPAPASSVTSGTAVTFSVKVSSTATTQPTGTVTFKVDGAAYKSPVAIAAGVASTSLTGLTTAAHSISATYSGDANYAAAGPLTQTLTVTAAAVKSGASVKLGTNSNPVSSCNPVNLSVLVSGNADITPTGSIQLKDGATVLSSASLANGSAAIQLLHLNPGMHVLTAEYGGDATHLPATSTQLQQMVNESISCHLPVTITKRLPQGTLTK